MPFPLNYYIIISYLPFTLHVTVYLNAVKYISKTIAFVYMAVAAVCCIHTYICVYGLLAWGHVYNIKVKTSLTESAYKIQVYIHICVWGWVKEKRVARSSLHKRDIPISFYRETLKQDKGTIVTTKQAKSHLFSSRLLVELIGFAFVYIKTHFRLCEMGYWGICLGCLRYIFR